MAKYSEAHKRAHQKWEKNNRYRTNCYFDISEKGKIQERSKDFGSVNAYILALVRADLEKWGGNNG